MVPEVQLKAKYEKLIAMHEELESKYDELLEKHKTTFVKKVYELLDPLDIKYYAPELGAFLSMDAEVRYCAKVQQALIVGLRDYGLATDEDVDAMVEAVKLIRPYEVYRLEKEVTKHDQLAVIQELSNHLPEETARKLHPGTTSYDILDTARSRMYKDALQQVIIPQTKKCLGVLCDLAEEYADRVQVGRTHGQWTSPVTFGYSIAHYAERLSRRLPKLVDIQHDLRGKIAGMVGTRASTGIFVGQEHALDFERRVLKFLHLEPVEAPTQIVPKEEVADMVHFMITSHGVLADMSNTMRDLQRSEIDEVSQADTLDRLGGSSADPSKNNPITFENIQGMYEGFIKNMILNTYELAVSDHQRDLRNSVIARFIPLVFAGYYDSLKRATRVMGNLAVIHESMDRNLDLANQKGNGEPMNAVLKRADFPNAHSRVNVWSKLAAKERRNLLEVALEDEEFAEVYSTLPENHQKRIQNNREHIGCAAEQTLNLVERIRAQLRLNE